MGGLREASWELKAKPLDELLAHGQTPWLLHWLAGVRAWKEQLNRGKKAHLAIALELDSMTTAVLAHTVYQMCIHGDLTLEDGFRILSVAAALDKTDSASIIDEVRGALLSRERSWIAAIVAYKAALATSGQDRRPDLHRALAQAYKKAGQESEASIHRRRAEELSAKRKTKDLAKS